MVFDIELVPCRSDNYAVILHNDRATILVDAPEEAPIREALARRGWTLTDILITHHHGDHVEALEPLKPGCTVHGPAADAHRIKGLDRLYQGGDQIEIGGARIEVIDTPGHTVGHIAYFVVEDRVLLAGDTLFSLGCGRLFEGTPAQMLASLDRLAALPGDSVVYCGHEYTLANARFAISVDPGNAALGTRIREVEALRADGKPTLPSRMDTEKATNPFLRADDPAIAAGLGLAGADRLTVFTRLRELKNKA